MIDDDENRGHSCRLVDDCQSETPNGSSLRLEYISREAEQVEGGFTPATKAHSA